MPALHYWFSGSALWLAGSFCITVFLGIIGIKEMISNKMVVFLIGLSVLVMFIGWRTTAEQEEKSSKIDVENIEMRTNVRLIAKAMGVQPELKIIEEATPAAILKTLEEQRKLLRDTTKNNFAFFKLRIDDPHMTEPFQWWLDSSGPVFTVNYWISAGSANHNANDPAYWSLDHRKPLIPIIKPGIQPTDRAFPIGDYIIEFDALNGHWDEYLSVYLEDGKLKQKIRVLDAKRKVIFDSEKATLK